MAQLNINTCTTRQLTNLQGIARPLAEAIIELRYRNNGIQRMDELLELPGMTRTKYQILCRRFCLAVQPLVLGFTKGRIFSKIPASSTEFICQGQSVRSKRDERPEPAGPAWRLEGQEQEGPLSLPTFKDKTSTDHNDKPLSNPRFGHTIHSKECSKKNQGRAPGVHLSQSHQAQAQCRPYPNKIAWSNDVKDTFPHLGGHTFTGQEPAVTLRATTSGDNINFSCTIDKRLLANPVQPYPDASQEWTLANHSYDMAITKVATENNTPPCQKEKLKRRPRSEGMHSSRSSLGEEYPGSGKPAAMAKDGELCWAACREPSVSTVVASTKTASSSGPDVCVLSTENLLLYDRRNRMTVRERRVYIEQWLRHVHDTFFEMMKPCSDIPSLEKNTPRIITKQRRQNPPLMIGPSARLNHRRDHFQLHHSVELKKRCWRKTPNQPLAARLTKSATAPDEDVVTDSHTDPINILHTRAVKSGLPSTNRLHGAQCVRGPDAVKIKHLINNYMKPRTEINNNVTDGLQNKVEIGRSIKLR